jgi:DNA-binding CsgD family transcriptional regulator
VLIVDTASLRRLLRYSEKLYDRTAIATARASRAAFSLLQNLKNRQHFHYSHLGVAGRRAAGASAAGDAAMVNPETFVTLVEQVYAAATEPERWVEFLDTLRATLRGGPAALFVQDISGEVSLLLSRGQDPAAVASYEQHYAKTNVWLAALERAPRRFAASHAILDRGEFERSEFYNDWLRPQDLYFGAGAVLPRDARWRTNLTVVRSRSSGHFDQAELQLFQRLAPHVQQSLAIHRRLSSLNRERRVTLDALDGLAVGCVLLDRAGMVLLANSVARRLFEEKDAITATDGRLRAVDPSAAAELAALLRDAVAPQTVISPTGGTLALPGRSGERISALVFPYRRLDADLDALDPSVIVMLGEQQAVFPPLPDHVAKLYALTPAEARLAAALLGGRTLAEYAEAAQLSVGTTRQYLKSIFQKTGTRRQAGLIATLLADPVLRFANAR